MLRAMAAHVRELGVRPELEVFDTGHLVMVKELLRDGLVDEPALIPAVHGHPLRGRGRPARPAGDARTCCRPAPVFAAFGIGRMQMPMVAEAVLAGRQRPRRARGQPLPRPRACWRPTASSSSAPARSSDLLGPRPRPRRGPRPPRPGGPPVSPDLPRRVALVGTGVIGAGWAARCLARGLDVTAWDSAPTPGAGCARQWRTPGRRSQRLGLAPDACRDRLAFVPVLERCVAGADLVQESAPGARGSEAPAPRPRQQHLPARALVASQHLGPAAEPPPGRRHRDPSASSSPTRSTRSTCCRWSRSWAARQTSGRRQGAARPPLPGARHVTRSGADRDRRLVADRLRGPLAEALHLVERRRGDGRRDRPRGCMGPGLRWAFMGSFLTYRLGGGEAGMRHFIAQFGPALSPLDQALEAPELTENSSTRSPSSPTPRRAAAAPPSWSGCATTAWSPSCGRWGSAAWGRRGAGRARGAARPGAGEPGRSCAPA